MLPKTGKGFRRGAQGEGYAVLIAASLRKELGTTHAAAKILMRWTGASERTAKNWLSGSSGPSGEHLIELLRHSDVILGAVLHMAGRGGAIYAAQLTELHSSLIAAAAAIEAAIDHVQTDRSPADGR